MSSASLVYETEACKKSFQFLHFHKLNISHLGRSEPSLDAVALKIYQLQKSEHNNLDALCRTNGQMKDEDFREKEEEKNACDFHF